MKYLCSKCHEEKDESEFYKKTLKIYCISCQKCYTKTYLKSPKGKKLRAKAQKRYRAKLKDSETDRFF